jgi:hypothetical protein
MCPHTAIYVSSYCYVCVLILLYMCPHTAIYVSSYCYRCTIRLATGGSRSGTTALVCGGWAILPTSVRRLEGRPLKGIIYRMHWYVAVGRYCRRRFDGWKGVRWKVLYLSSYCCVCLSTKCVSAYYWYLGSSYCYTRMLTYADICWNMLTYADICWRMLTYPGSSYCYTRMLTYAEICWRMLTYADVCWHI